MRWHILLCRMRSGERRSDGGVVPAAKQAIRPCRVRRDRFSPPAGHHISAGSGQAEWKPPPTGDRSRSGHQNAKGSIDCMHNVATLILLLWCQVKILHSSPQRFSFGRPLWAQEICRHIIDKLALSTLGMLNDTCIPDIELQIQYPVLKITR